MTTPHIDIARFDDMATAGYVVRGRWGNGTTLVRACTLAAAVGVIDIDGCVAKGWPQWLAEIVMHLADGLPEDDLWLRRQRELLLAIQAADPASLAFDGPVSCVVRRSAILPIALESIGEGDEPWRVQCREVVLSVMESGRAAEAEAAAWAAEAAEEARAARAAEAANVRIHDALVSALAGVAA